MKRPECCERCGKTAPVLRTLVASNGAVMIAWWCKSCQNWALEPIAWIAHHVVRHYLAGYGKRIEDIPVVKDMRVPPEATLFDTPH